MFILEDQIQVLEITLMYTEEILQVELVMAKLRLQIETHLETALQTTEDTTIEVLTIPIEETLLEEIILEVTQEAQIAEAIHLAEEVVVLTLEVVLHQAEEALHHEVEDKLQLIF